MFYTWWPILLSLLRRVLLISLFSDYCFAVALIYSLYWFQQEMKAFLCNPCIFPSRNEKRLCTVFSFLLCITEKARQKVSHLLDV
jgi:hypothetical protein